MEKQVFDEGFYSHTCSVIMSKSKRLKQHARRASGRAAKQGKSQVQCLWPEEVTAVAQQHNHWHIDVFMQVAVVTMEQYLKHNGLQVETYDGIKAPQYRKQLEQLVKNQSSSIGIDKRIPTKSV